MANYYVELHFVLRREGDLSQRKPFQTARLGYTDADLGRGRVAAAKALSDLLRHASRKIDEALMREYHSQAAELARAAAGNGQGGDVTIAVGRGGRGGAGVPSIGDPGPARPTKGPIIRPGQTHTVRPPGIVDKDGMGRKK